MKGLEAVEKIKGLSFQLAILYAAATCLSLRHGEAAWTAKFMKASGLYGAYGVIVAGAQKQFLLQHSQPTDQKEGPG
jgi:hypothetical protein